MMWFVREEFSFGGPLSTEVVRPSPSLSPFGDQRLIYLVSSYIQLVVREKVPRGVKGCRGDSRRRPLNGIAVLQFSWRCFRVGRNIWRGRKRVKHRLRINIRDLGNALNVWASLAREKRVGTRQPRVGLGLLKKPFREASLLPASVLQFLVLKTRRSLSTPAINRCGYRPVWYRYRIVAAVPERSCFHRVMSRLKTVNYQESFANYQTGMEACEHKEKPRTILDAAFKEASDTEDLSLRNRGQCYFCRALSSIPCDTEKLLCGKVGRC
ncbi:hypothetical protein TNCV_5105871 [Trichonephila clavipes]|nr:hypothetical protein TNCV_5105871 [Trichonephila clavipes]